MPRYTSHTSPPLPRAFCLSNLTNLFDLLVLLIARISWWMVAPRATPLHALRSQKFELRPLVLPTIHCKRSPANSGLLDVLPLPAKRLATTPIEIARALRKRGWLHRLRRGKYCNPSKTYRLLLCRFAYTSSDIACEEFWAQSRRLHLRPLILAGTHCKRTKTFDERLLDIPDACFARAIRLLVASVYLARCLTNFVSVQLHFLRLTVYLSARGCVLCHWLVRESCKFLVDFLRGGYTKENAKYVFSVVIRFMLAPALTCDEQTNTAGRTSPASGSGADSECTIVEENSGSMAASSSFADLSSSTFVWEIPEDRQGQESKNVGTVVETQSVQSKDVDAPFLEIVLPSSRSCVRFTTSDSVETNLRLLFSDGCFPSPHLSIAVAV
ncbi:hypothetical protein EW146_g2657 [Bondarzewia mesenterica]|uniref:Uncharacterized protein n=1 Tax=Bondarzewia mesenterica TaxID=1095465 RepID=A0A4S4M006_9AGAM|nr:hypothetical protein EW146_g2657 [Bondarzewia mesenterica]